jgi:hypothetical protein
MMRLSEVRVFPTIHTIGKHRQPHRAQTAPSCADSPIVRMNRKRGYEGREALGNRPHEDDGAVRSQLISYDTHRREAHDRRQPHRAYVHREPKRGASRRHTLRHGVAQRQVVHGRGDGARVRERALDMLRRACRPAAPTASSGRTTPTAAKVAASASAPAASTLIANVAWPTHPRRSQSLVVRLLT